MKQTIQLVFSHLSHPVLFHSGWPVGPPCDRGGTKDREGGGQDRGLSTGVCVGGLLAPYSTLLAF